MSSELAQSIRGTVLVKASCCFLSLDMRALCALSPEGIIRLCRVKTNEKVGCLNIPFLER